MSEEYNHEEWEKKKEISDVIESLKDLENGGELFMEWLISEGLYLESGTDLKILEHDKYTVSLSYLATKTDEDGKPYTKSMKLFAYILNVYYPGKFEEMFQELIENEEYEKCEILKQYIGNKTIPHIER